nr:NAD kinase [Raineyella antarctica]
MAGDRRVAVITHTHRPEAVQAAAQFIHAVSARDVTCVLPQADAAEMDSALTGAGLQTDLLDSEGTNGCELVVVFGGDGTILRGVEWALSVDLPILGVNLGHVGFLAEAESSQIDQVVSAVSKRSYHTETRLTVRVRVLSGPGGDVLWESFAVNEASLEKASRQRMLEAVVAVNDQPLSRWGCDGILVATPTGSTAYSFSAGGPVTWPGVDAMLIVPLSAHALFNRPVVVPADAHVNVQVVEAEQNTAVVWLDGRRSFDLQPGNVLEVTRGAHRLQLARIAPDDFTGRLVRKFGLSIQGWRGAAESRGA